MAADVGIGARIDMDRDGLAWTHISKLRLFEIASHPHLQWHDRHHLLAGGDEIAGSGIALGHMSRDRRDDTFVTHSYARLTHQRLHRIHLGFRCLRLRGRGVARRRLSLRLAGGCIALGSRVPRLRLRLINLLLRDRFGIDPLQFAVAI